MGVSTPEYRQCALPSTVFCGSSKLFRLILLCFVLFQGICSFSANAAELIVNPVLGLQSLKRETVRSLFTMRLRSWQDGTRVRVFVLSDRHPVHREFSKQVLGVFPHQLRRSWDRMVYSGLAQAPTEVADEAAMAQQVAETPGAVGYLSGPEKGRGVSFVAVE